MLKESKRLLAVCLAVAFAITTFGSDFSYAKVSAADEETVKEITSEEDISTVEWENISDTENVNNEDLSGQGAGADEEEHNSIPEEEATDEAVSEAQNQETVVEETVEEKSQEVAPAEETTISEENVPLDNTPSEVTEESSAEGSSEDAASSSSSDEAALESSSSAATESSSDAASAEASDKDKKVNSPAQKFSGDSVGIHVEVEAGEGVFPAGTTMTVVAVSDLDAIDAAKDALGEDVQQARGVNITFYNADGKEIEPLDSKCVQVSISLGNDLSGESFSVIHKDDAGNTEKVADASSDGASFSANSFSVYIVAGSGNSKDDTTDKRAICTYVFTDRGTEFNTQLVKEGDNLAHPGIPKTGSNEEFLGWFTADDKEVKFGKVEHVVANSKVEVFSKIQTTYYLTYIGVDGEVVHVKKIVVVTGDSTMVDVNDVTTEPKHDTQAFLGWSRDKNSKTLIKEKIDIASVHEVYAVVTGVHWIYFDENDGVKGGGATYTDPIHVQTGKTATPPADPERHGYDFKGWYEKQGSKVGTVDESSAFDWGKVFADSDPDITLYAKWEPKEEAEFTVVIWKQNIGDSKTITDNSAKNYDYQETYTKKAKVGTPVSKAIAGDWASIEKGFQYSWLEGVRIENGSPVSCDTIRAEEDTIINLYYDRDLMTIIFKDKNGNSYKGLEFTGLYGQRLSMYNYVWPVEGAPWAYKNNVLEPGKTVNLHIDFVDAFIFDAYVTGNTLVLYDIHNGESSHDVYYYYQELDGITYTLDKKITHYGTEGKNYYFYCDDYYTGFKPEYYIQNGAEHKMDVGTEIIGQFTDDNTDDLHLYFKRLSSKIEFKDNFDGNTSLVSADPVFSNILYEMPLDGSVNGIEYESLAPDLSTDPAYDKSGYKFVGWCVDEGGQKLYDWKEKMPLANKVLYAKYEKIKCKVTLIPNGGTLIPGQKDEFYKWYRESLKKDTMVNCVKRPGYEFVGWFEDSNGQNPYGYGEILNDITLTAMWRRPGNVTVEYDAGEHGDQSTVPDDGYIYAVDSQAVVGAPPKKVEDGWVFIGWKITNDSTNILYYPNNYFGIKKDYLVDNGVVDGLEMKKVVLVAQYNSRSEIKIDPEYTTITYHSNDPRNLTRDVILGPDGVTKLKVNEAVKALTLAEAGFERPGYTFLGWSKRPGDNRAYKFADPGANIAADNDGVPNDLYAIWYIEPDTPPDNPPTPPDNPPSTPENPPAEPATTTTAAPAGQVLGARRETGSGQAVLGARRARTEDTTNLALRVLAIVAAGAVAAGLLMTSRKKDDEQRED
ncbi:InlB B-repeat-containing protein [Butyrivibrio sp. VCB2006]|uniref:InlB B-repeat-containing protein n=1 Tax=Butyrivibrio sp. VCB2006 TaxID=1280679 RepID=UPI0003F87B52|nr:InlB B-repeat-containing protein [Butyrivibrio sp. VCB2006]